MSTITDHHHSFLQSTWPFKDPQNSSGFTTVRLWADKLPILRAFHCPNGDWQFFDGDIKEGDECLMVCLGCIYESDRSIGILGTLPRGWFATREAIGSSWQCEPYDENQ